VEATAPVFVHEAAPFTGRLITTNHKTGTFMTRCLIAVLAQAGIHLRQADVHTWGFPSISCASDPSCASNPDVLHINLVRNPFVMVHSEYMYHRGTKHAEAWTIHPFSKMGARYSAYATESFQKATGKGHLMPTGRSTRAQT
jgi:hypothetical protein